MASSCRAGLDLGQHLMRAGRRAIADQCAGRQRFNRMVPVVRGGLRIEHPQEVRLAAAACGRLQPEGGFGDLSVAEALRLKGGDRIPLSAALCRGKD